eukprot:Nk52_evm1s1715 gene=Nk52_evmTU1s1715
MTKEKDALKIEKEEEEIGLRNERSPLKKRHSLSTPDWVLNSRRSFESSKNFFEGIRNGGAGGGGVGISSAPHGGQGGPRGDVARGWNSPRLGPGVGACRSLSFGGGPVRSVSPPTTLGQGQPCSKDNTAFLEDCIEKIKGMTGECRRALGSAEEGGSPFVSSSGSMMNYPSDYKKVLKENEELRKRVRGMEERERKREQVSPSSSSLPFPQHMRELDSLKASAVHKVNTLLMRCAAHEQSREYQLHSLRKECSDVGEGIATTEKYKNAMVQTQEALQNLHGLLDAILEEKEIKQMSSSQKIPHRNSGTSTVTATTTSISTSSSAILPSAPPLSLHPSKHSAPPLPPKPSLQSLPLPHNRPLRRASGAAVASATENPLRAEDNNAAEKHDTKGYQYSSSSSSPSSASSPTQTLNTINR